MADGAGDILIGTAGWSIPSAVADAFPGEGAHLQRYARRMPLAEINSSFHKPHRRATYERWAASTPAGFRFSAKVPKAVTHERRLLDPEPVLDWFADEVAGLGDKLAVLLVQTMPSLTFEPERVEAFLDALAERLPQPVVWEPRHTSWFTAEADAFLAERRVARVVADPAKPAGADEPGGWRDLTYVRLHGSPRMYYSAYGPEWLAGMAGRLREWAASGPVWCVLDNTAGSAALGDALTLTRLSGHGGG
jgi:uncharacterized protein YecE (DUF72 family)